MRAVWKFIKKDMVLTTAWVLAVISAFFVHPDAVYVDYIDWRSLGILWGLMVIMQGFQDNNLFIHIGSLLLKKTGSVRQLVAVLVFLCFVSSMLITNDVALITFVPFAILVLKQCNKEKLMIPTLVLQTVAANLGSMLTPVGNPQNLYLYGISGMSMGEFVRIMLPYTVLAAVLLCISVLLIKTEKSDGETVSRVSVASEFPKLNKRKIIVFLGLFLLALLTVLRLVSFCILVIAVLIASLITERKTLKEVDYALLLTFVGFFIFTGNISRIPIVRTAFETVISGHEIIASVLASQCISNVPAALLLSGFTREYSALLLGVNFGGLGTLIASMASLISYKQFTRVRTGQTKKYLFCFTVVNVVFLVALLGMNFCLSHV